MTYQQPGGFGGGNSNEDFTEIPHTEDTITDPEFWDQFWNRAQNQEPQVSDLSDDELNPTERPVSSPPTHQLTKKSIQDNNFLTNTLHPVEVKDWKGDTIVIKAKAVKKSVFSHRIQAGTSSMEDLVKSLIQTDSTKYH